MQKKTQNSGSGIRGSENCVIGGPPVDICCLLTCVFSWGKVGEALKFQSSLLNLKSWRDFELKVLKSNKIPLFPDLCVFWFLEKKCLLLGLY